MMSQSSSKVDTAGEFSNLDNLYPMKHDIAVLLSNANDENAKKSTVVRNCCRENFKLVEIVANLSRIEEMQHLLWVIQ